MYVYALTVGERESLLLVVGKADAVPRVVVTRIYADGVAVTGQRLLQLLDHDVLVAEQSVGVRKVGIHLREMNQMKLIVLRSILFSQE